MKKEAILLLVLALIVLVHAKIPDDCDKSMIAYLKFDSNLQDSYSTNHASGPAVFDNTWKMGSVGASLKLFDNYTLSIPSSEDLSLIKNTGSTIEFWIKPLSNGTIIEKGNYAVGISNDHIYFKFNSVSINTTITSQQEHFVSAVRDPISQKLILYLDGVKKAEETFTIPTSSSNQITIGGNFNGSLDELAFYSRALNSSEIKSHHDISKNHDYCYPSQTTSPKNSLAKTSFHIAGCKYGNKDLAPGTCSLDGLYFCHPTKGLLDTLASEDVCKIGNKQCCPEGYECKKVTLNNKQFYSCELRETECSSYTNQKDCSNHFCFWIAGKCAELPRDFSCSSYTDKDSCEKDLWNLGKQGIGTSICGYRFTANNKNYIIPQSSCDCRWLGDKCVLSYKILPDIYGKKLQVEECQKGFITGSCKDSKQEIKTIIYKQPSDGAVKKSSQCIKEVYTKVCGGKIIQVPGVSIYSLAISLLLLLGYYKTQNKKEINKKI